MKKIALMLMAAFFGFALFSCGLGHNKDADPSDLLEDDEAFYSTQPMVSGFYNVETYDITGKNDRKGKFDGRMYLSLNPKMSALNVFENGNRTKIDYTIPFTKPFEKGDSGIYKTKDILGNPIVLVKDTTLYFLTFTKHDEEITVGINPEPRYTDKAYNIIMKMHDRVKKNKN